MRERPTNSDDVIDSRDVIAAIEELEQERQDLVDAVDELEAEDEPDAKAVDEARSALGTWDASEEAAELKALKEFAEEAEGYAPDWVHSAALIRDSYFTDYVEDLANDIGAVSKDNSSWVVIDWEATANNVKVDYTSVEFDGVTYWVR